MTNFNKLIDGKLDSIIVFTTGQYLTCVSNSFIMSE